MCTYSQLKNKIQKNRFSDTFNMKMPILHNDEHFGVLVLVP